MAAGTDGHVLRRSGTTLGFGTVATAGIADDAVTYAKMQNVSATSRILGRKTASAGDTEECTLSEILDFIGSAAQGDILYRGSSSWARLGAGTAGQVLQTGGSGANPAWATVIPTGTIWMYTKDSATPPTGWLMCDGSSISSTTYLALHAVISNTYGGSAYTGAGGLNFNLPDFRGRSPLGTGDGTGAALTNRNIADTGGTETHTLTSSEMPAHVHGPSVGAQIWERNFGGGLDVDLTFAAGGKDGAKNTTGSTGGGGAHNNMHPWLAVHFIIKF
jgi:microcystin-dependent protein